MTFELTEAVSVLSRTPAVLRALLNGLPEPWLSTAEGPDTFSPRDVLGHLISGEITDWVPRIKRILGEGEAKPFEPFDRFSFRDAIGQRSITALLDEFDDRRRANLAWLDGLKLTPAQMSLRGRHPAFGPVTLGQLLSTWTVHDLNHLGQIVRVMSKRYGADVGPWREYLGILKWETR